MPRVFHVYVVDEIRLSAPLLPSRTNLVPGSSILGNGV